MDKDSEVAAASELWEQSRAKDICEKLCAQHRFMAAWKFYQNKNPYQIKDKNHKKYLPKEVLLQGSANFDEKHDANDQNEKRFYRVRAYVKQYLSMHLRQNLVALHRHKDALFANAQNLLFVDFGCGPMTGGIALRDIAKITGAPTDITYLGVDASKNMLELAKAVNHKYKIFAPERFFVYPAKDINVPRLRGQWDTMILNLSFVLAPTTLKTEGSQQKTVKTLAHQWSNWVQEAEPRNMMTLYCNPERESFHANWKRLTVELGTRMPQGYRLLPHPKKQQIWWHEKREPCYSDVIHWRT